MLDVYLCCHMISPTVQLQSKEVDIIPLDIALQMHYLFYSLFVQDLSFVDFSFACLKNVFFSRANLQCAKFRVGLIFK